MRGWAKLAAIQAMGGKHLAYFREPVRVIVEPWALNRRYRHDVGNCYPSFKAVLDGCVDAGVITDDSDSFIFEVVFRAHQFGRDEIALTFMEGG